jgi:glycogen synthase
VRCSIGYSIDNGSSDYDRIYYVRQIIALVTAVVTAVPTSTAHIYLPEYSIGNGGAEPNYGISNGGADYDSMYWYVLSPLFTSDYSIGNGGGNVGADLFSLVILFHMPTECQ